MCILLCGSGKFVLHVLKLREAYICIPENISVSSSDCFIEQQVQNTALCCVPQTKLSDRLEKDLRSPRPEQPLAEYHREVHTHTQYTVHTVLKSLCL